jgi:tartronate-semialdehyde synthase
MPRMTAARANPGNIGVCIGTSGPAGTDMITGLVR